MDEKIINISLGGPGY